MSMHGGSGAMASAGRMGMRSMRQDRRILEHRIKRGTLPRILQFAKPYRPVLIIFLVAVVLDAIVSSISPLVLRAIIDKGIHGHREGLIIGLAFLTAGLALSTRSSRCSSEGSRPSSAKVSSTTCAPGSSATSKRCRSPSFRVPRPAH
jgi:hypothetical protein